jgi:hypothetical protein
VAKKLSQSMVIFATGAPSLKDIRLKKERGTEQQASGVPDAGGRTLRRPAKAMTRFAPTVLSFSANEPSRHLAVGRLPGRGFGKSPAYDSDNFVSARTFRVQ